MDRSKGIGILSGNALKIIAAISMVIDHTGVIFFPDVLIFRIIGRLGLPIFAFMIAEGCRYTKNKLKYFLSLLILGTACQLVYDVVSGSVYIGILISFSVSVLLVYLLGAFYKAIFARKAVISVALGAAFAASVVTVYILNTLVSVDYGFWGCMMPVFASLTNLPIDAESRLKRIDKPFVRVLCMSACVVVYAINRGGFRLFALMSIPVLLLYSGKRGAWRMKYFFYIFYPLHLALLWGIYMLIRML